MGAIRLKNANAGRFPVILSGDDKGVLANCEIHLRRISRDN
ncbi:hypothetical protein X744_03685 [Mesorhizobium sp. LNJC372A00]|nr:hypothetical protein X771_27460 [Mesorhizobium sp. LSJC277A00]ESX11779.1 hypothetical protein X768_09540 [Mesorhizobium sp. LSJC265A00]ESY09197.1 hypothetical protein X752_21595 [Mesorhizobium sp. LNJC398B00]ESY39177.1 hypothetical protein X748_05475 [Mesorhizobium sp. LNJC386A00]ESY54310.1 hypothetical protein X745_12785 [Mesorhizobium sp. LNJC374B00]ESY62168.1 hypothetical protein X744_03685 [Mesorhizobium sp. LNJC372A00]ESZ59678.1 hypothetical protein X728_18085 [Mesorhizobium sp. L103C